MVHRVFAVSVTVEDDDARLLGAKMGAKAEWMKKITGALPVFAAKGTEEAKDAPLIFATTFRKAR